jgi:NAD(P)-dependent dehydrogenase (short-subunit alcohol dehydrogenase family)
MNFKPIKDLSGQTAVITGANGGIGRAICQSLAASGARIVGLVRSNIDDFESFLNTLPGNGHYAIKTDVTKTDELIRARDSVNQCDLLITSAGSESLDLKNTRFIHIMEPHWNESKISQIIGRAIRYDSHKSLPDSEKSVEIVKWISVFGYKIPYETADEYLLHIAEKKDKMFEQFNEIIKISSI